VTDDAATATLDPNAQASSHGFTADVARLLQMMAHSVYSERDVFLRELVSNAADASEKLRYEALSNEALAAKGVRKDARRKRQALQGSARHHRARQGQAPVDGRRQWRRHGEDELVSALGNHPPIPARAPFSIRSAAGTTIKNSAKG